MITEINKGKCDRLFLDFISGNPAVYSSGDLSSSEYLVRCCPVASTSSICVYSFYPDALFTPIRVACFSELLRLRQKKHLFISSVVPHLFLFNFDCSPKGSGD